MKYRCLTANNPKTQKLFMSLPSLLYTEDCPQNVKAEKQLLTRTHVLSPDIKIYPFTVIDENNNPICRCMMTYYNDDPTAYVGFFESQDDIDAVRKMMYYVERRAKKDGKTALVGPIDASIFINYRFKTNCFDSTYTNEPYNKEYYRLLWEECGFSICDKYTSYQMRAVGEDEFDAQLEVTYNKYLEDGYEFKTPDPYEFDDCLEDIYELFMIRHANELGYQPMTKDQFEKLYEPIEDVIDYEMTKLAYKGDDLKGFSIALHNCGPLTRGKMNPIKFIKALKIIYNPTEYVLFCDGAYEDCQDLNKVLIHLTMNVLKEKHCTSISRIVNENDNSSDCYRSLHRDEYRYVLMSKWLDYDNN